MPKEVPEVADELRGAQRAFYADPEFSDDDDEDEQQVGILYSCEVNVVQPLADDDEDGSQSEPDFDEGDNGCQVFDLCTVSRREGNRIVYSLRKLIYRIVCRAAGERYGKASN